MNFIKYIFVIYKLYYKNYIILHVLAGTEQMKREQKPCCTENVRGVVQNSVPIANMQNLMILH